MTARGVFDHQLRRIPCAHSARGGKDRFGRAGRAWRSADDLRPAGDQRSTGRSRSVRTRSRPIYGHEIGDLPRRPAARATHSLGLRLGSRGRRSIIARAPCHSRAMQASGRAEHRAARKLLAWYDRHARALAVAQPAGHAARLIPYRVWLSEVMLPAAPPWRRCIPLFSSVSPPAGRRCAALARGGGGPR
jgi:hypothetical protein